jgi:hypothetical protein
VSQWIIRGYCDVAIEGKETGWLPGSDLEEREIMENEVRLMQIQSKNASRTRSEDKGETYGLNEVSFKFEL